MSSVSVRVQGPYWEEFCAHGQAGDGASGCNANLCLRSVRLLTLQSSNLPAGAAILLMVLLSFKLTNSDQASRRLRLRTKLYSMDPLGIVLLLAAVSCLFLVLQQGGNAWPWQSGRIIGLLFSFAIILSLFGIVQWKLGDEATVPLRLLKDRTILLGSLFLALSNASSYVVRHFHYLIVYVDALKVRILLMPIARNCTTYLSISKRFTPLLPSSLESNFYLWRFRKWFPHF